MAHHNARHLILSITLASVTGMANGQAQDPAREADKPVPSGTPLQPVPLQPTQRPAPSGVVPGQPSAADAIPGLGRRDLRAGTGLLLREGTFLVDREALVIRAPTGELIAVFGTTPQSDPPMVLLPGQTLSGIDSLMRDGRERLRLTISGEVTAYQQRNYLMPTTYRLAPLQTSTPQHDIDDSEPSDDTEPVDDTESDDTGPTDAPPPTDSALPDDPTRDPRVEALIRDLESTRPQRTREPSQPISPPGMPSATPDQASPVAGIAPTLAGIAEGTLVVRQRGRLERQSGGRLAFVADGDLDSPPPTAMLLLPNGRLQALDRLVESRGLEVEIQISGRVYRSAKATLLLASSFSVLPPERESEITPLQ